MKTTVLKTIIAFALICKSLGAVAITRYVNSARPNNTSDGLSWVTAYKDLQDALDAVQVGDEIWVTAGKYYPAQAPDGTVSSGLLDRNNAFHFATDMKVYGGFAGIGTLLSQRNRNTNLTVLLENSVTMM